jgi:hypothetical protein
MVFTTRGVNVIVSEGEDVYVDGGFSSVAGAAGTDNIARWDSRLGSWISVGGGLSGVVSDLAASRSNLYALYCNLGGQHLDRFDGNNWSTIWDVIAGYYKVRAQKDGCVSPDDPNVPYVETGILTIPPQATDLELVLVCKEQVLFLPWIGE